jgi:hypothetical protein
MGSSEKKNFGLEQDFCPAASRGHLYDIEVERDIIGGEPDAIQPLLSV